MKTSLLYLVATFVITLSVSAGSSTAVDSTGIKLLGARENEKAQAFFEAAVKQHPDDAELHYWLAVSLLRQHKIGEAQDEIDEALDRNEKISKYHFIRGAILGEKAMNANVISQAVLAPKVKNAFLRAAELDPKNIDAHIGLFNYYFQAPGIMGGSEEKALAEARIAVALDQYRGHMMLAGYYGKKNNTADAESELKKAIEANPAKLDAYYQYGMLLDKQKKPELANAQFKKLIDTDPKSFDGYYMYGRAMFNLERWDLAIEKFQYALYIDKANDNAIWMLANCYEKKGLTAKARETYQWFLQVDPVGRRGDTARQKVKDLQ
jgi:tetratricopeptide (TPR) repeat protein